MLLFYPNIMKIQLLYCKDNNKILRKVNKILKKCLTNNNNLHFLPINSSIILIKISKISNC